MNGKDAHFEMRRCICSSFSITFTHVHLIAMGMSLNCFWCKFKTIIIMIATICLLQAPEISTVKLWNLNEKHCGKKNWIGTDAVNCNMIFQGIQYILVVGSSNDINSWKYYLIGNFTSAACRVWFIFVIYYMNTLPSKT